jgi:hypothetical protein
VGIFLIEGKTDWSMVLAGWSSADKAVAVWYYEISLAGRAREHKDEVFIKAFARDIAESLAKGTCPMSLASSRLYRGARMNTGIARGMELRG